MPARRRRRVRGDSIDWDVHVANRCATDLLGPRRRPRDLPAPADWYPAHAGALRATRDRARMEAAPCRSPPATTRTPATGSRSMMSCSDSCACSSGRADHGRGLPRYASVFDPTGRFLSLREASGRSPSASRASPTSSPAGDSWPAPKAPTARSTTVFASLGVLEGACCGKRQDRRPMAQRRHGARRPSSARRSRPRCHRRRTDRLSGAGSPDCPPLLSPVAFTGPSGRRDALQRRRVVVIFLVIAAVASSVSLSAPASSPADHALDQVFRRRRPCPAMATLRPGVALPPPTGLSSCCVLGRLITVAPSSCAVCHSTWTSAWTATAG